jgi:hypothetical protein
VSKLNKEAPAHARLLPASSHGAYVMEDNVWLWRPASAVHAKAVGSLRAACGYCYPYWKTFWDMNLPADNDPRWCSECRLVVNPRPQVVGTAH